MIFGNRKVHSDLYIIIHNDQITRVSETKLLDVWSEINFLSPPLLGLIYIGLHPKLVNVTPELSS